MNLNILIADDEQEARELVIHFLNETGVSCAIKETSDGVSAHEAWLSKNFDIIFLDISMPGLSGMQVLKQISKPDMPAVIFTTAFEQHAVDAYDHNAVDYLLKPFNKERFQKAFNKAIGYLKLKRLENGQRFLTTISVKQGSKILLVPVSEIEFFQAKAEYIAAVTRTGSYLFSSTLSELENALDPQVFVRVHKSAIVNTSFISRIENHSSGDFTIIMKGAGEVRGSRNFKERLRMVVGG